MQPYLTIGMAHFEDYDGVYFTIQNLRANYPDLMRRTEFVLVDNSPDTEHGKLVRDLTDHDPSNGRHAPAAVDNMGSKYIAMPANKGTSITREAIFTHAEGEYVLVMDCHLVHHRDNLLPLLRYYQDNPDTRNIISGPIVYDDLRRYSSHYDIQWRSEMFGTWSMAWTDDDGRNFCVRDNKGTCSFHDLLTGEQITLEEVSSPIGFAGHERKLEELGFFTLTSIGEPFEIPGQGLGMFSCKREHWPGFNPDALGFGGEELYIHEKFRLLGAKAICLPGMKWTHRFGRVGGAKYPLTVWNKVRNYVLEAQELQRLSTELGRPRPQLSLDDVFQHFVIDTKKMPEHEWEELVADPVNVKHPKGTGKNPATVSGTLHLTKAKGGSNTEKMQKQAVKHESIEGYFLHLQGVDRDLNQHMGTLSKLAEDCETIVEMSIRKESTVAFVNGLDKRESGGTLISFNPESDPIVEHFTKQSDKIQVLSHPVSPGDVRDMNGECELLFINWRHTYQAVYQTLYKFAPSSSRYIVIHNTQIYGEKGEDSGEGILKALRVYMRANPKWSVIEHHTHQYGLTILSCRDEDKPKLPGKIEMAKNFTKAIANHVADGMTKVEPEELERRLEICNPCPQRNNNSCSICGCGLSDKASWRSSECPIGKWEESDEV